MLLNVTTAFVRTKYLSGALHLQNHTILKKTRTDSQAMLFGIQQRSTCILKRRVSYTVFLSVPWKSKECIHLDLSWVPARPYLTWYPLLFWAEFVFSKVNKVWLPWDLRDLTDPAHTLTISQCNDRLSEGSTKRFKQVGGQCSFGGLIWVWKALSHSPCEVSLIPPW